MRISWWCGAFGIALATVACRPASGQDQGITVSGTGEVKAKPTQLEIDLKTAGSAELAGDAIVKYRDAQRRALAALDGLKIKNLRIEPRGLSITSGGGSSPEALAAMMGRGQNTAAKPQVGLSRGLRVVLRDIQRMPEEELTATVAKILDTAKDSGAAVGGSEPDALMTMMFNRAATSSSVVAFVLDDASELREQAYRKAFDQAQGRARRLAELAKVSLGPVLSVREAADAGGASADTKGIYERMVTVMYGAAGGPGESKDPRVTSSEFTDIPVRVTLEVRFAIQERTGKP